jgi:hypothetical protein
MELVEAGYHPIKHTFDIWHMSKVSGILADPGSEAF